MSYSGTVRCGKCYESGHNRRSCPQLKRAWENDPGCFEAREYLRHEASKKAPKTCSYCKVIGHTRAGCAEMKKHKLAYHQDAVLFRKAIAKWMRETGLAVGALIRAKDSQYYTETGYCYPGTDDYVPPVGMVMDVDPSASHYSAISGSSEWMNPQTLLSMEVLGTQNLTDFRRGVGLSLPCIPGIVPRLGLDWYKTAVDRQDRATNIDWEVVSPGHQHFDSTSWISDAKVKSETKEHFGRGNDQESGEFRTFTDEQREQIQNYINGSVDLSEMKDPELPNNDS